MISLRGAPVDSRVVGGFNQLGAPVPGSSGTIDPRAVVQYPGTSTIAVRGGVHIWPEGFAIQVQVDWHGAIHLLAPAGFRPRLAMRLPRDQAASLTVASPAVEHRAAALELI